MSDIVDELAPGTKEAVQRYFEMAKEIYRLQRGPEMRCVPDIVLQLLASDTVELRSLLKEWCESSAKEAAFKGQDYWFPLRR